MTNLLKTLLFFLIQREMTEKQILEIKDFAFKSPVDFISNLASFLFLVHAIPPARVICTGRWGSIAKEDKSTLAFNGVVYLRGR